MSNKAHQTDTTVPILDRELFFGDPEITAAELSPDGQLIAFIKPYKGTRNVWVKRTGDPFDKARRVTADLKRPIPGYIWSRDGRYILFAQDKAGDENYNVWAVNPADPPAPGEEVPAARNLTHLEGVRAQIYDVPKKDPDVVFVGLNDRDAAWHDLYRVTISTGERTLLRKNTDRIAQWFFDNGGTLRLALRIAENGDSEILRVEENRFTTIYSCTVFETCFPVRFNADNKLVYIVTDKGEESDLTHLSLLNRDSGVEEFVESDPLNRVDFGAATFSERTDELIATIYEDERTRPYFKDKAFQSDYDWLQERLRDKEVSFISGTRDELLFLVGAHSDREPGETYLFDRETRALTFQYRIREELPREYLCEMKPISYRSSDGLEIPAFLTLPAGIEQKNLPLVVVPHGGPWFRDSWGYNPISQFLSNRGYAVLQPNFRGSIGYGKRFL